MYKRLLSLIITLFIGINIVYAQELHWIPDTTLRNAVRDRLRLSDETPLRTSDMAKLRDLVVSESDIADLRGLEHAVNLRFLHLSRSQIIGITPLAGLVSLLVPTPVSV